MADVMIDQNNDEDYSDINKAMNIVRYIQDKWLQIGNKLKVSQDTLDSICKEADKGKKIPPESIKTFCCIQMLKYWLRESKDVSIDTLIKAIKTPHFELQSKVPSIIDELNSPLCSDTSKDTYEVVPEPPEMHEQYYAGMKADFYAELCRHHHVINNVSIPSKISEKIKHIDDVSELIVLLEKHGCLNSADLSYLKSITKCTEALEVISRYEKHLMADKTKWFHHTRHPDGTFVVGKVAKNPENITLKDVSDAKLAASKIVGIKETDAILKFSELHFSEVLFYWKIIDEDLNLHIPEIIKSPMLECTSISVTHVGIMTNGKMLKIVKVGELQTMEGTIIEGPSSLAYLPGVTPLPIELTCSGRRVNGIPYALDQLDNEDLPGRNAAGTNILVNSPVNNTECICGSLTNNTLLNSDLTIADSRIQSLINNFKSHYVNQKYSIDEKWSPYQCKSFIKLAFVVHKSPKTKKISEVNSTTMQCGGNVIGCDSEIVFSDVTTQTDLSSIFGNSTSDNLNSSVKITLIEGAPGIGKTAVAQEIAYQWARKEMVSHIELLLLTYLKQIDTHKITNFEELMHHCYPDDKEIAYRCAEYFISTQGKNLMIIFDGYDEITGADQEMTDNYFMKLLQRETLPYCYLAVTSRPYVTAQLHQYCNCRVEIMGFTKDDRHSYFRKHLSSKKLNTVAKFLEEHLIIDSLCYIPLNLVNFLSLVEYDIPLPKTQTELTSYTVHLTVARNIDKKRNFVNGNKNSIFEDREISKIITDIASFAYKMLDKEQFVFSETDIKSIGFHIENKHENYGLLKAEQINDVENKQKKNVYSFVHFSVQEYLAAYHLSKMCDIAQAFLVKHKFWDVKYFGVWRMYTGLTKGSNFPLQIFLSKEWCLMGQYSLGLKFPGIADELKMNKVMCLKLFQILLEAPDSEIKESLSDVVKKDTIDLSGENLFLTDIKMLSCFVARSYITKEWHIINLCKCNINDDKLILFCQGLCIEDGREKTLIRFLDISQNNICELNTLMDLITNCKVITHLKASKNLCKYNCNATNNNDHYNETLKILDLSGNQLSSEAVRSLCKEALTKCKNLEELDLSSNDLDDDATGPLIEAIVQWDNFRELKYEDNNFSDPNYTSSLLEFTINHLQFNSKILDFKGDVRKINHFIKLLGYTRDVSTKNSNYISCISQLCELDMQCVVEEHSPFAVLAMDFSKLFQTHFQVLEKLNLSGLTINEESASAITFGYKLQYLKINRCKLTSKVAVIIAHKLQIAGCIKQLELCNNYIDNDATKELIVAFLHCNSFERFKFQGNQFTNTSEALFNFLLCQMKFSSLTMNLRGNLDNLISFINLLGYMKDIPTNKSQYVNNVSRVINLDLNCLALLPQLELTVTESEGFQIFRDLVLLNISGIVINEIIGNYLVKVFNSLELEKLFLNKCQISSATIKLFCQKLKFNSLKVFEIMENCIDDEAIEELAITILHWNLLECIKLQKNNFSIQCMLLLKMLTEDVESLSVIDFANSHYAVKAFIEVLDYASNHTGERVTQFLTNLSKVTKLSLKVKPFLEMTSNASNTLIKEIRYVTSLNISGIIIIEEVADNLCSFFDNNQKSLQHLIMNDCKLNSIKILKFVHMLKLTGGIKEAEFCNNEIDDDATDQLVIAFSHWTVIQILDLKNNNFKERSMKVFQMLKEFSNFHDKSINFNSNIDKIDTFITLLGYMKNAEVHNCVIVKNVSEVEKLLLDCTEQSKIDLQFEVNVSRFFTRFVNLTELNISGIQITTKVAGDLAIAFSGKYSLERLIMNSCKLTSTIICIIIEQLQNCLKLTELKLSDNNIDDTAVKAIVVAIFLWEDFKVFKFKGNWFSQENEFLFEFLLYHLKFSSPSLNLSSNWRHLTSFITLLQYMKEVPTNKSKYVENICEVNTLNFSYLDQISSGPLLELTVTSSEDFQIFNQLVSLNVSGIVINDHIAKCLIKTIENNWLQLKELFMNKCLITTPIIKVLCQQLQCVSLKVFEIMENCIDDKAIKELAITILHWDSLERIKSLKNNFSVLCMLLLRMLTEEVEPLSVIDFANNPYAVKAFIEVLDYASNHTGKRVIQFLTNLLKVTKLSLEVQVPLEMTSNASGILMEMKNMTLLNVSGIIITEQVADSICGCFNNNNQKSLNCLIMNNCQLTSSVVITLIRKLPSCIGMKELQLCNNHINDEAAETLIVSILQLNKLQLLKLEQNSFSIKYEKVFHFLAKYLNFSDSVIDFSNNMDSIVAFVILLEFMENISFNVSKFVDNVSKVNILSLDCSKQNNDSQDIELELTVVSSQFFQRFDLTKLNLSGIVIKEITVINNFLEAFGTDLQSMEYLLLSKCNLNSKLVTALILKLRNAKNLKGIELCNNNIDDDATDTLIRSILLWNSLKYIKLENNQFTERSIPIFNILNRLLKSPSTDFTGKVDEVTPFISVLGYMENIDIKNSVLSQNVMKTNKLLLDCSEQNDTDVWFINDAAKFITRFVNLTELNISGIVISRTVAENLAKTFDNSYNFLECLIMNNCQLTSSTTKILMKKINRCSRIRELQLSKNKIDDKEANMLIVSILQMNVLETLSLEQNCFTDRYVKVFHFLANNLKFSGTIINFSNELDKIIALLTLLEHMKDIPKKCSNFVDYVSKVNSLNLDCSNQSMAIHQIELSVKASHFFQRFQFTLLNLSGIIISGAVVDRLFNVFGTNLQNLEYLYMNNCNLNSRIAIILLEGLKNIKKVKELHLRCNDIDDKVTETLAMAILNWNLFQKLNLDKTKLSEGNKLLLNLVTNDFQHKIDFSNNYDIIKIFIVLVNCIDQNTDKKSSKFTRNLSKTTHFLLSYNQHHQQQPLSFQTSSFFLYFIYLQVLNISGIIINEQAACVLSNAFGSNLHTLHQLIMNKCCLTSKMFENFVTQLKGDQYLQELQYCDNNICDEAVESTAIAILSWNSLKYIAFSKEKFSSKCVMLLDLLVKSTTPTLIDFSNDYFSIKSLLSVLHCANESTNNNVISFNANISEVSELSLNCSQVKSTVEISCKAVAMLKNFTCLIKLNFSGILISEDKTSTFVTIFQTHLQNLHSLFLNYCQLTSISVSRFVQALQRKDIKEIELCNNLLDDEATKSLAIAILHWKAPTIKLQGNSFSRISLIQLNLLTNKTVFHCNSFIIDNDANIRSFLAILKCISNEKFYVKKRINVSMISHLSLKCSSTKRLELSNASNSFKYFINLSELEISGIIINKQAARTMSQTLSTNHTTMLRVLKLTSCCLSSHSAAIILLSVQNKVNAKLTLNNLVHLNLSDNHIEDNATNSLIKALLQMPYLKSVNVDENKFKNQNMKVIVDFVLKFKELKSPVLKLQNSEHITTFIIILSCVKNISKNTFNHSTFVKLEELHLQCEDIYKPISFTKNTCLSSKLFTNLRTLKLYGVCFTSKKAITMFADCLAHCFSSLQELRLNNCKLDSSSAVNLFSCEKGLPVAFKKLKHLDISNNYLKDESNVVNLMVRCLLQMPNLVSLNTEGNEIGKYIDKIFSIILDLKNSKSSLTYQNSDNIAAIFAILSSAKKISGERSCQVDNIINIKRLVLQNDKYKLIATDGVFHFFERFSTLNELNLSGIYIKESAASLISNALSNNLNCLHELKLMNCQLDSYSIIILLPSFKTPIPVAYKMLKVIDFSNNNICDEAIIPLVTSLLQMCHLEKLNLNNNKFVKYNINKIFQIVFDSKNMTEQRFRNKENSVLYIISFLTFLSSAKHVLSEVSQQVENLVKITQLKLKCTDVSDQCMLTKEPSLFFKRFSLLKALNLCGIQIQPEAVTVIAKALDSNLHLLEKLKLCACEINSESAIEIISSLNKDKIKYLCLSKNKIDHKVAKSISDFVSSNNIVTEIKMSHNNLATKGTVTLTEGLISCISLVKLDLSYNNITDDATEALVKLVKQVIKRGSYIKINNNKLSYQSKETLNLLDDLDIKKV